MGVIDSPAEGRVHLLTCRLEVHSSNVTRLSRAFEEQIEQAQFCGNHEMKMVLGPGGSEMGRARVLWTSPGEGPLWFCRVGVKCQENREKEKLLTKQKSTREREPSLQRALNPEPTPSELTPLNQPRPEPPWNLPL